MNDIVIELGPVGTGDFVRNGSPCCLRGWQYHGIYAAISIARDCRWIKLDEASSAAARRLALELWDDPGRDWYFRRSPKGWNGTKDARKAINEMPLLDLNDDYLTPLGRALCRDAAFEAMGYELE